MYITFMEEEDRCMWPSFLLGSPWTLAKLIRRKEVETAKGAQTTVNMSGRTSRDCCSETTLLYCSRDRVYKSF